MEKVPDRNGSTQPLRAQLRILATTDLHMHLLPYDYLSDRPSDTRGLARTASLIAQARAEVETCLLVDNGDFLTGTPMDDEFTQRAQEGTSDALHPMIEAMNGLGYDAGTLGNHDFDHGITRLEKVLSGAAFPIVLTNVRPPAAPNDEVSDTAPPDQIMPWLAPHVLLDRTVTCQDGRTRPLRVGIFGVLPPHSIRPRRSLRSTPHTEDIVDTARRIVPELRAKGADIILALAHTGIGEALHSPEMENALLPLSRVTGIDAIIGGHAHQVFPGDKRPSPSRELSLDSGHVNGVPTVVPGFWGSHLGIIDLDLSAVEETAGQETDKGRSRRRWRVCTSRGHLRAIYQRDGNGQAFATVPDDPRIAARLTEDHQRTLTYVRTPVGSNHTRLHSYFSLVTPNAAVQLVQRVQRDYARDRLKGTALEGMPILSSASALKCGGIGGPDHYTDIPAGEVTLRMIADMYLYPNDLVALKINGAMLRSWLERSASVFNRLSAEVADRPLVAQTTPCYLFETVLGVTYRIDLEQPALFTPRGAPQAVPSGTTKGRGRIRGLCHDGREVLDGDDFILVTNGFRATGGGHYPGAARAERVLGSGDCIRDILCDHFRAGHHTQAAPEDHWRLQAPAGTTATFDCSPRAVSLIAQQAPRGEADELGPVLAPLAALPSGFHRFRLTF